MNRASTTKDKKTALKQEVEANKHPTSDAEIYNWERSQNMKFSPEK